jgi:DNA topoisomerase-2
LATSTATGCAFCGAVSEAPAAASATRDAEDALIEMAFARDRVDERKAWLDQYVGDDNEDAITVIDHSRAALSYAEFVNHELVLFSRLSLVRAVPRLLDGLKPGQRKVLFACFRRKLTQEIKVAQLAGYVAEHTNYHHGEAALSATIIGMAQDYCGSNNVPLLVPAGQFGTRLLGGKDAASPRYLFTRLAPAARLLYREVDDGCAAARGRGRRPRAAGDVRADRAGGAAQWRRWRRHGLEHDGAVVSPARRRRERRARARRQAAQARCCRGGVTLAATVQRGRRRQGRAGDARRRQGDRQADDRDHRAAVGRWTTTQKEYLEEMLEIGTIESFRELHTEHSVHFVVTVSPRHLKEYTASRKAIAARVSTRVESVAAQHASV